MTISTTRRRPARRSRRPEPWPLLSEAEARDVITQDLRVAAGVPADWWRGELQIELQVLVATHDRDLAAQAADELARRDFGARQGFLDLVGTSAVVQGPIPAVLVGWVGSDKLDWRPAGNAPYALYICLVGPDEAEQLAIALEWENTQQDGGVLDGHLRRTCRTCRVWTSPAHIASPGHQAASYRPVGGEPR